MNVRSWTLENLRTAEPAAWSFVSALVVIVLAMLAMFFHDETAGLVRVWSGSRTYNHCFLILPLALWMIWSRRGQAAATPLCPTFWPLLLIIPVSLIWLAAVVVGVLEIQQFAVLGLAEVILLACLGRRLFVCLSAPLLYLFLLVPSGDFLTRPLQDFTAAFTTTGLHILGVPVHSDGAIINVRSGVFVVEEACAGLRFLIATIALGVFFACEMYSDLRKRVLFIATCCVVPIIANGFRALGIVLASEAFGNQTAAVVDHVTYGFFFFGVVLAILLSVGSFFADREGGSQPARDAAPSWDWRSQMRPLALVFSLGMLAAAIGPFYNTAFADNSSATLPIAAPAAGPSWQKDAGADTWRPDIHGAAKSFQDVHSDGGATIYRYVAVYPAYSQKYKLVRSDNRIADERQWQYGSSGYAQIRTQAGAVPVRTTVIGAGNVSRLVVSFYVVNGVVVSRAWEAKLLQLRGYLRRRPCASAFVALGADLAPGETPMPALERYLAAMQPLSAYLCPR